MHWGGGRCANHRTLFQPLLTQTYLVVSGGVVRHWQRHVHALFVLPDARHWSAGIRLSAWRIFWRQTIVLSKIIKPGKVTAAVADGFRDDSRQFAGHSAGNVFKSGI